MLYLIHGTDRDAVRTKSTTLVNQLRAKKPDASYIVVTDENWHADALPEYTGGQGLFTNKCIVLMRNLCQDKEIRSVLMDHMDEIKESENIFIISEGELDKASLRKFEKYAEKIQEYNLKDSAGTVRAKAAEKFNTFKLADALGARDRKGLWLGLNEARFAGVDDEPIVGILWWQFKAIELARSGKTATQSGLNPFVHGKAQRYAEVYSREESLAASFELIRLYHEARRGNLDFEVSFEKWCLGV